MRKFKKALAKLVVVAMLITTAAGFAPAKNVAAAALSEYLNMEFGIKYTGERAAVKNEAGNAWSIEFFNVADSAFQAGDVFFVSCKVSGAASFKQACVQSGVNNWDWATAPKTWANDGIADGTTFSAVIKATQDCDKITFKLWFDNPVEETFDTTPVAMTLTDLQIKDIAPVADLGEAYKNHFAVGAAVSASMIDDVEYQHIIKSCFKTITAENEMKPDALLNQKASQEAAEADADAEPVLNLEYSGMSKILDFAKDNGLKVRGHSLLYAQQTPDWFFNEGYTANGAKVDATTMEARMESYIRQVIEFVDTNYPGVVTAWDVVNEALDNDGTVKSDNWSDIMGDDYIATAFFYANYYAPEETKLYYNDFNMEESAKKAAFLALAPSFDRIDGIGMQEHISLTYPTVANIGAAVDAYKTAGLDVQITELDVQIEADETVEAQTDRYEALFTMFKSKSDKISNVTLWGIDDGTSWRKAKRPLLFYSDLTQGFW